MKLYRIASSRFIHDLSGTGARIVGGRWNSIGVPMLYTSESQALCILEKLVHVDTDLLPKNLEMAEIEVPDEMPMDVFTDPDKKVAFNSFPTQDYTQKIGDRFIRENKFLLLKVPSIISRRDFNYLINPGHKDFGAIKITTVEPFGFDTRILIKN